MKGQPLEQFVRRLALKCGRADYRAFCEEVDVEDVIGWLAFWSVEPFGQEWLQAARAAVVVAGTMAKLPDEAEEMFQPNWLPEDHVQSDAEMIAVLAMVPEFQKQMRDAGVI
ncbi:hypothetical protein UFOVP1124_13 [uncultured Caudovirales phage]|uniref:Uncharacterized protein n=1 Tax=uncultured Caudovirales phage TaxID=2100421 RepID=A0A6J5QIM4_9CAUD|nr:hypothetical protein UFOVP1124_13 [uncultured Caudovirales phage]